MNWSDIVPLLELVYLNYTMNGSNDDIENQVSEIFFRLRYCYVDFASTPTLISRPSLGF